jgi:predicted Zn finger-like uncharacterized protein
MILTCPNCGTQYVVKDGAIPPEGRQVRCAACKHSWHQDPELATLPEEGPEAANASDPEHEPHPDGEADAIPEAADRAPEEDESLSEATLIEPRSGPEAEERAYEEAVIEGETEGPVASAADEPVPENIHAEPEMAEPEPAAADWEEPPTAEAAPDMFSPFSAEDELEPRRRSPALTILILVLLVIVAAAAFWFFAPVGLKAKLGLTAADATSLKIVTTHMDRQHLESGNELLTLTGRVINPSANEQSVPPLQAQLKNHNGKIVYSWTIPAPAPSLAAGASASFNSAEVSVPPGGEELTITLDQDSGRAS